MVSEFSPPMPPPPEMVLKLWEDLVTELWEIMSDFSWVELGTSYHLAIDIISIINFGLISSL